MTTDELISNAWHRAYSHWYDHDRAGHRIRAAAWGWGADRICRITKTTASGVNATQGVYCFPDGADDAPDKAKEGVPAPSCPTGRSDHECVFVEEREPSGRLVLPPCIICGLAAMDAIEVYATRRLRSMGRVAESGTDDELGLD